MRTITSLAILATTAAFAFGQSFTESFDTGPSGWLDTTTVNFGNSGPTNMAFASGTWVAFNNSVPVGATGVFCNPAGVFPTHSGAGHANFNFNSTTGANTIDTWLMSMVRTFNNGDTISFWTRTATNNPFPDRLFLKLSLNGASTSVGDFSTTLVAVNNGLVTGGAYPETYTQFSATLSGLGGPTSGRFALNYNVPNGGPGGANSNFIGVDDVEYVSNPVPEPATMALLAVGAAAALRRRRK